MEKLTIDAKQLMRMSITKRAELQASLGDEILNAMSPSERARLFPKYLKEATASGGSSPSIGGAMAAPASSYDSSGYSTGGTYSQQASEPQSTGTPSKTAMNKPEPKKNEWVGDVEKSTGMKIPAPAYTKGPSGKNDSPLSQQRRPVGETMSREDKLHMYALTIAETGGKNDADNHALMESAYNRMNAQGYKSIQSVTTKGYYEPLRSWRPGFKNYNRALAELKKNPELFNKMDAIHEDVLNGSNYSNYGTHNSSAGIAADARKTQTVTAEVGELYSRKDRSEYAGEHGAGTVKNERNWYKQSKEAQDSWEAQQATGTGKIEPTPDAGALAPKPFALPENTDPQVKEWYNGLAPNQKEYVNEQITKNGIDTFNKASQERQKKIVEAAAQPKATGLGKKYDISNYKGDNARAASGIDPMLMEGMQEGAKRAFGDPNDPTTRYHLVFQNGLRNDSTSKHGQAKATDIQIFDRETGKYIAGPSTWKGGKNGIMVDAFDNPYTYRKYEALGQGARQYVHEKYGDKAAGRMRWGGYFKNTRQGGLGPDVMHYSLDEGQSLGNLATGAFKNKMKSGLTVNEWINKHGGEESRGMGDDITQWKSEFNPANIDPATANGSIMPTPDAGALAPKEPVVPTETAMKDRGITAWAGSGQGEEGGAEEEPKIATTPATQKPFAPRGSATAAPAPQTPQTAPTAPTATPQAQAAPEAPKDIPKAAETAPEPKADDAPKMKTGGRVRASGEEFSIVDNNSKRKLGEVGRGENINFKKDGHVNVMPEHRTDPRDIEVKRQTRQEQAKEIAEERKVKNEVIDNTVKQVQASQIDKTSFAHREQWGHTPTPNSFTRAMEQAKGRRNTGSFAGSRFGEDQGSTIK